jgi:hypothetical protein
MRNLWAITKLPTKLKLARTSLADRHVGSAPGGMLLRRWDPQRPEVQEGLISAETTTFMIQAFIPASRGPMDPKKSDMMLERSQLRQLHSR